MEEGRGKIGLIDLEEFTPECDKRKEEWCFFKCREAVRLFPHHLDEILSVAKNYDPDIETYRQSLELERAGGLQRFKLVFDDHLKFIEQKGITVGNPLQLAEIPSTRKEHIKEALVEFLRQEHDKGFYKDCLGENPKEVVELFGNSFPKILDSTTTFLAEMLKRRMDNDREPISSLYQLVSYRSLLLSTGSKWYRDLQKQVAQSLQVIEMEDEWERETFALSIIKSVFAELAKGEEIAYYNPNIGNNTLCVFW